jgi:predicted PurR-regulated permease PerM
MTQQKPRLRDSQPGLTVISAVVLVWLPILLYCLRHILLPFTVAGIVAFVCTPLADGLAARTRLPRWCFALTLLVALVTCVTLLAIMTVPELFREIARLRGDLPVDINQLLQAPLAVRTLTLLDTTVDPAQLAHSVAAALHS